MYDHKPFPTGGKEIPDDKKIINMMVRSRTISEIIENPSILYDEMFMKFWKFNDEFNYVKRHSQFIYHYKNPEFNFMVIPVESEIPRLTMCASIRKCDDILSVRTYYHINEDLMKTFNEDPTFIKFMEIYVEQLFRFAYKISGGSMIKTKQAFEYYCPGSSKETFLEFFRKYRKLEKEEIKK